MPLLADHLYTTTKASNVGVGLLTTVDNLPAILKRQYPTSYKPKSVAIRRSALLVETPLDLTVKTHGQIEFVANITPPSTPSPPKKRYKYALETSATVVPEFKIKTEENQPLPKTKGETAIPTTKDPIVKEKFSERSVEKKKVLLAKNEDASAKQKQVTPKKPILSTGDSDLKMGKNSMRPGKKQKRNKATRKLKFDEDTSSPVSGTIIRRLEEIEDEDQIGDIDPEYNIVEVTEEAKAEIAAIENVIGDYQCRLCRKLFEDAFELARHRCSCIVLLEYRCPECGKRFNCPANLASHRRWHKPRPHGRGAAGKGTAAASDKYSCTQCKKSFKRLAYLKKHQLTHSATKVKQLVESEDTHQSHSNGSYYSNEEQMRAEDEQSVAMELYHEPQSQETLPNKLQTFTQIVFRYASSMTPSEEDDNIVYSTMSRESTPVSMCSMPSPQQHSRRHGSLTEDENLAAAALAALGRNGHSVIRHTTLSV